MTAPEPAKGLMLAVYRRSGNAGYDGTLGGITATADRVVLTGILRGRRTVPLPADCQVVTPTPGMPEVTLVYRDNGTGRPWLHLEPAHGAPAGTTGWMDGGNFAGDGDSRWSKLTTGIELLRVHDRAEPAALTAQLST